LRTEWWSDALAQAFAVSLAVHILAFGVIEIGHQAGWWKVSSLKALSKAMPSLKNLARQQNAQSQNNSKQQLSEPPLLFVDVSPAQATPEPPKQAKYYSSVNSKAANPTPPKVPSDAPRIDGTQNKMAKTIDTPRPQSTPPNPPPQPPSQAEKGQQEKPEKVYETMQPDVKPAVPENKPLAKAETPRPTGLKPGNTQMGEPGPKPVGNTKAQQSAANEMTATPSPEKTRPRTLAEARQRQGFLAGEKMKQEGGVKRFAMTSSLDVKATPFGQYDAMFIAAVQKRWFDLLEERDFIQGRSGRVVLRFHLYYDGRITNMEAAETSVGELLSLVCQRAVLDPAPFAPWPPDLRRLAKSNFRQVQFTFYYN
jgi:hypothetical protein